MVLQSGIDANVFYHDEDRLQKLKMIAIGETNGSRCFGLLANIDTLISYWVAKWRPPQGC